jgi:hypothetical protein
MIDHVTQTLTPARELLNTTIELARAENRADHTTIRNPRVQSYLKRHGFSAAPV